MNTFKDFSWINKWNLATEKALGITQISDFMVYFPVYLYPDTIKNCRLFIMKRFNVTTFEEAFNLFTPVVMSPVSVILTYAYVYERDRYDWHIDIGNKKLTEYNNWRLPACKHLCMKDITPSIHFTIHSSYYKLNYEIFEQSLCYLQINLNLQRHSVCEKFINKVNYQLFEFCNTLKQNHLNTWCKQTDNLCAPLIKNAYDRLAYLYNRRELCFSTRAIRVVEELSLSVFGETCKPIHYEAIGGCRI